MFLDNIKIRTKILSVLIPICLIGIGGVAVVANNYKNADTAYTHFMDVDNVVAIELARANRNLVAAAYGAYQLVAYRPDDSNFQEIRNFYQSSAESMIALFNSVKASIPEESSTIDAFITEARSIVALMDSAVEFAVASRDDEAKSQLAKADTLITQMIPRVADYLDSRVKGIADASDSLTARTSTTILTSLSVIGGAFLFGIIAALFIISKGITGPVDRLRARMLSLASGETQAEIAGLGRKDEVGQMAEAVAVFRDNALERIRLEQEAEANRSLSEKERIEREAQKAKEAEDIKFAVDNLAAGLSKLSDGDVSYRIGQPFTAALDGVRGDFNNSAEKLESALTRVAENARGIGAGANEIKSASDDLAKRTEQQAAAIEETAAALEQITTTVRDSTRRAQEAGQLVSRARSGAEQSGEVMQRAIAAMQAIEKSSEEISNIIGVIDEIAFQTNLLALNAGVEAARAGDAGKGFAVVAQEVRELAQRSANAAKEIKTLIGTSGEQVREGVHLVGDTGKALGTIVSEVQEINRHVNAIVEAAQEQSSGLQQINTAVNQMDQDTQKNAAMVEETTAATYSLSREVTSLNELLALFRLSNASAQSSPQSATSQSQPVASPAQGLVRKLASAFG